MNTKASEAAAELLAALRDDVMTPRDWERPSWWTAELDEASPVARYTVRTKAAARKLLWTFRDPEAAARSKRESYEKRKVKNAARKVQHYLTKLPEYEARAAELEKALAEGLHLAKREDGEPFVWWYEAEDDLKRVRSKISQARAALKDWQGLVPEPAP